MKTLIIDRFEGSYAICEDGDQRLFGIETSELPQGVKEGDVLKISDEGEISVDQEATEGRRAKIRKKQNTLWE